SAGKSTGGAFPNRQVERCGPSCRFPCGSVSILSIPLRIIAFLVLAIVGLLRLVGGVLGVALRIILPTVAGAILFGILGVIGGMNHHDADFRVPAAVLIGAGIGALYGLF